LRPQIRFETVLDFGGKGLALTPDGSACIAGAYRAQGIACYAAADGRMLWQRRRPFELWRWSASTGAATRVTTLPRSATFEFCRRGSALLGADGQMIDTLTGRIDYHLASDQVG
jgi:hypothetical protein